MLLRHHLSPNEDAGDALSGASKGVWEAYLLEQQIFRDESRKAAKTIYTQLM